MTEFFVILRNPKDCEGSEILRVSGETLRMTKRDVILSVAKDLGFFVAILLRMTKRDVILSVAKDLKILRRHTPQNDKILVITLCTLPYALSVIKGAHT